MKYEEISDLLILNYEALKITIYEEVKVLYIDHIHILRKWNELAYQMTPAELLTQKPTKDMYSFGILISLFTEAFFLNKPITKKMVREVVETSAETIKGILASHLYQEFPEEKNFSVNEEQINEVMEREQLVSSADIDFHLMRDMVTKKRDFKEDGEGNYATEIIDNRGNIKGLAKLQPHELDSPIFGDEQDVWLETLGETLNSLDDLTADLFDLISFLWLTSPKSTDGYLEFHSDDALRLRNIQEKKSSSGNELGFREEDRFNIMRRVAALSSIWVSLAERKVQIIDAKDVPKNERYKFKDFQKLFEVGKIRVAYDIDTGQSKGIYALQIRPTSLLTRYLDGPKRTLGIIDLKVIQYSHISHRAHKRLTRYLNLQWRIRTVKKNLSQPFKVSTLLKEMDFASRYKPGEIRDRFENTLDDLQGDGVIQSWRYTVDIDEALVGKKGWFNNYWSKLSVQITPPEEIIKENRKSFNLSAPMVEEDLMDRIQLISEDSWSSMPPTPTTRKVPTKRRKSVLEGQLSMLDINSEAESDLNSEGQAQDIVLSPELMKETLETFKVSIRQAAEEIGMAHTTLSRFIKQEHKRPNKKNDEKMIKWLKKMHENN